MGNTGVSNAKRIDYFDLAKGLCIFLVVFHHYCSYSYVSEPLAFRCFFKAFRLPLYFFLSGVFFKRYGGLLDFIKRKCNKLLIPFAFWFFLDVLLGKFCKISLSSGVIWFLLCLFEVNIFFYVISLVSERFGKHKTKMLIIMTMLCGCIGIALNFLSIKLPLYIDSAFTALPFFSLGEDVDKYMIASYALELTDLMLEEGQSAKGMYNLIVEFLGLLEKRKNSYDTLLVAFMLKALKLSGSAPVLEGCVKCGCKENLKAFSVPDGGLICENCYDAPARLNPLIFEVSNDIINVTVFIENHPLRSLENLALPKESEVLLKRILKAYFAFHLGIENLKSEGLKI